MADRRSLQRIGLWMFVFTALVFLLSRVLVMADSNYSMLLSENIILHHTTDLSACQFPAPIREDSRCVPPLPPIPLKSVTFQLARINGAVEYCYPHGTSILSIPFVALMKMFGVSPLTPSDSYNQNGEAVIQRVLAALLMAAFTVVVFRTALLLLGAWPSLLIAGGTAFGTQVWSTASRAMWSHTWLIFLGGLVAFSLVRCEAGQSKPRPLLLATLLSWMYFTRPTGSIPVLCVTLYMFLFYRRQFIPYALTGMAWFAGFVVYSWLAFGKPIPDYYLSSQFDLRGLPSNLAAILISPSRGLFIFVPVLLFVFYLPLRYWKTIPLRRVATLMLAMVAIQVLMIGLWQIWWGGNSYGPRLLADSIPWLAVLAILGCASRLPADGPARFSRTEIVAAALLLAMSIAINGHGAMSSATVDWYNIVDIDDHPDRAWDWSYPQFMAGLIAPPQYR